VRSKAAVFLIILGLAQMGGDAVRAAGARLGVGTLESTGAAIKGIAAATTVSPAPKVFSAVRGLETYSTNFFLEWTDFEGTDRSLQLTPEVYSRLRGPYNRRNVYGAVLAYGPVLASDARTQPMFESVARFALCGEAPVLIELGVDPSDVRGPVRIRLAPRTGARLDDLPLTLEAPCR
jgi:hypothetical protein